MDIYTIYGDYSLRVVIADTEEEAFTIANIPEEARDRFRIYKEKFEKGEVASYIE